MSQLAFEHWIFGVSQIGKSSINFHIRRIHLRVSGYLIFACERFLEIPVFGLVLKVSFPRDIRSTSLRKSIEHLFMSKIVWIHLRTSSHKVLEHDWWLKITDCRCWLFSGFQESPIVEKVVNLHIRRNPSPYSRYMIFACDRLFQTGPRIGVL